MPFIETAFNFKLLYLNHTLQAVGITVACVTFFPQEFKVAAHLAHRMRTLSSILKQRLRKKTLSEALMFLIYIRKLLGSSIRRSILYSYKGFRRFSVFM
jgi:hypothetical protein